MSKISFKEHLKQEREKKHEATRKVTRMATLKHNRRPAAMILIGGCSFDNILSACLESGYYQQHRIEGKMK